MDQTKKNPAARLGFSKNAHGRNQSSADCTIKPIKAVPDIMRSCPNWESCNAPICPLDADWKKRNMLRGEAVCRYLREYAKVTSGKASNYFFQGSLPEEVQKVIAKAYPDILASHGRINSAMKRAAKTPSKLGLVPGVAVEKQNNGGLCYGR
jgi:hypothetical protein